MKSYIPSIAQAEINGQIVWIDFASENLHAYDDLPIELEYLGMGLHYSVNGVRQKSDQLCHFWKKKENEYPDPEPLNFLMESADLTRELNILQARIIGLFVNGQILANKKFELVLSDHDGLLHTITIGELGGLYETHISKEKGIYKKFPGDRSLLEMKSNPFALEGFIKSFNQK